MTDFAQLSRLEAVTARLEALESKLSGGAGVGSAGVVSGGAAMGGHDSAFVKAFDTLLSDFFTPIESRAEACGADVVTIVQAFKSALIAQRGMLTVAAKCRKPNDMDLQKVLAPTSEAMAKVESLKDRRSKQFNHLSMVAEGCGCLQWVCIDKTPAGFLSDVIPASEMYGNKVMMEFKGKDENQCAFAKNFKTFLLELQKYIKAHHTTGLSWNPSGGSDYSAGSAAAPPAAKGPPPPPAAPAGGPPPPPPPPPAGYMESKLGAAAAPAPAADTAALFAELRAKGERVAAGLKKVDKDQMTHKNPALRGSSVVQAGSVKSSDSGPSKVVAAKKPPKMEQIGQKWFIENFEDKRDLEIVDGTVKTAVCMVKCNKSVLQVKGKINTLQIDGCVKTSVVVDSCVASLDIINCKSCEIQITDWTPMITMDGCSGVIVYLSQKCVDDDVSIVSSKCSEMNIVLPAKTDAEDPTELPVPEQYETRIRGGKLVTGPISHVGA